MWLKLLQAQNLRSFSRLDLNLSPGINFFVGENGVGKTSILEAVDVLSRGKSFRSSNLRNIVNFNASDLTLFTEIQQNSENCVHMGVQYDSGKTDLRLNRKPVKKWSELANHLPVIDIQPESYLLITGGPIERRKFLAWGTFHVEPSFLKYWVDYSRALKQRNICLKEKKIQEAKHWHELLSMNGESIDRFFRDYLDQLIPHISELLSEFELSEEIKFSYIPGFEGTSLNDELEKELLNQQLPQFTRCGPHRADIKLQWNNQVFAKTSSRGQQKVLAIVLKLAQARLLLKEQNKASIYLIDELPAELDSKRCVSALNIINAHKSQALITSISAERIENITKIDSKMFHVEPGKATEMV
ncbi:MAG: DNA replication/repair protein RecF [Pseudomonadota bacterium]